MNPRSLHGLQPDTYLHPLEQKALDRLQKTKGLSLLVSKFHEIGLEHNMQWQYRSNSIKATDRNFTHLIYLLEKAMDILQFRQVVELYIERSDQLEGLSIGTETPMIIISSHAVDTLNQQELLFVLGREVGHLAHQHTLYKEIGLIFPDLIEAFSVVTLGISSLVSTGLRYALHHWDRMSELTADRGGMLACQDPNTCLIFFGKLAGWPPSQWSNFKSVSFEEQVEHYDRGKEGTYDKVISYLLGRNSWAIARAKELSQWQQEGSYTDIIQGHPG